MRIAGPLLVARLVERPNRFVLHLEPEAAYDDDEPVDVPRGVIRAHLPNPGRLPEFRTPATRWVVRHTPGAGRRTRWRAVMGHHRGRFVVLDTQLANGLVAEGLQDGAFPAWAGWSWRPEVRSGAHRFDFGLRKGRATCLLEVKSVNLVPSRTALFPDAPTTRGTSHVRRLAARARRGARAAVLFVIARDDVDGLRPHAGNDPAFAAALKEAIEAGVDVRAWTTTLDGRQWRLGREVAVHMDG